METKEQETRKERNLRMRKLPFVKAIMLEKNPDTGRMLLSDPPVVKAFDRISWERMVKVVRKDFNWKYVEHLPVRPGNDDVLKPEVTGGKELSTYVEVKK
jgi:hypothetical protein